MLSLEAIDHAYGDQDVLAGVSLEIERGSAVAVVGPNGAGKTTLLRVAAGLLEPDEGRMLLEGEALRSLSRREIARRISLLRQASPQIFGFSAVELVLMGFHARSGRFSLPSGAQRRRAMEAMERLEIADLAERPAPALSGGELQRVLMARTLVAETPLWLLDEPTAHLDYRHRVTLLDEAVAHVEQGGCVLAAMHDLSLVQRFFDRVLVLADGRAVAQGAIDETFEEELLSEVYGVRIRKGRVGDSTVWIPVGRAR